MTLSTNLQDLATRTGTEDKALRTLINGNQPTNGALTTTAKANLVAAINELDAAIDTLVTGGTATSLDALTDVVITSAAIGDILRHNGTTWVDVLGSDYFVTPSALTTAINALINSAPGTLDTLGEIATALASDESAAAALTTLVNSKQAGDADLTAIAALTSAANTVPYATGAQAWALTAFTPAGRALVGAADVAAERLLLDVYSKAEIGDINVDLVATFVAAL